MTPKDKAEELFSKYYDFVDSNYTEHATRTTVKRCAIICVDEIIETHKEVYYNSVGQGRNQRTMGYWTSVKQELEQM